MAFILRDLFGTLPALFAITLLTHLNNIENKGAFWPLNGIVPPLVN